MSENTSSPGPTENTVRSANGQVLTVAASPDHRLRRALLGLKGDNEVNDRKKDRL